MLIPLATLFTLVGLKLTQDRSIAKGGGFVLLAYTLCFKDKKTLGISLGKWHHFSRPAHQTVCVSRLIQANLLQVNLRRFAHVNWWSRWHKYALVTYAVNVWSAKAISHVDPFVWKPFRQIPASFTVWCYHWKGKWYSLLRFAMDVGRNFARDEII